MRVSKPVVTFSPHAFEGERRELHRPPTPIPSKREIHSDTPFSPSPSGIANRGPAVRLPSINPYNSSKKAHANSESSSESSPASTNRNRREKESFVERHSNAIICALSVVAILLFVAIDT